MKWNKWEAANKSSHKEIRRRRRRRKREISSHLAIELRSIKSTRSSATIQITPHCKLESENVRHAEAQISFPPLFSPSKKKEKKRKTNPSNPIPALPEEPGRHYRIASGMQRHLWAPKAMKREAGGARKSPLLPPMGPGPSSAVAPHSAIVAKLLWQGQHFSKAPKKFSSIAKRQTNPIQSRNFLFTSFSLPSPPLPPPPPPPSSSTSTSSSCYFFLFQTFLKRPEFLTSAPEKERKSRKKEALIYLLISLCQHAVKLTRVNCWSEPCLPLH